MKDLSQTGCDGGYIRGNGHIRRKAVALQNVQPKLRSTLLRWLAYSDE